MKVKTQWTAKDFLNITGNPPEQDDLERVNCPHAGEDGHEQCGVCKHNYPEFLICRHCVAERN